MSRLFAVSVPPLLCSVNVFGGHAAVTMLNAYLSTLTLFGFRINLIEALLAFKWYAGLELQSVLQDSIDKWWEDNGGGITDGGGVTGFDSVSAMSRLSTAVPPPSKYAGGRVVAARDCAVLLLAPCPRAFPGPSCSVFGAAVLAIAAWCLMSLL
jgi:hypothetical protein